MISICWTAIQAVSADLARDVAILDGANAYHGELRGPAIAPIAIAAIACCHGPEALPGHPSLSPLRPDRGSVEPPDSSRRAGIARSAR